MRRAFSNTPPFPLLTPLLRSAADGPDAPVSAAVHAFTGSPAPLRAASLGALYAAAGGSPPALEAAFSRAASGSPLALPFLRSVREVAGGGGGDGGGGGAAAAAPWSRCVDAAALAVLRPLYGPSLTPLLRLELDSPAPAMRALVGAAAASEVVRPAGEGDGFRVKFGWRRAVFALHHAAEPGRLLAVVYAALLAGGPPRSLAALDAASGGAGPGRTGVPPPPGAPAWPLSEAHPGGGGGGASTTPAPAPDTAAFYSVGTGAAGAAGRGLRLGTRLIYGAGGAVVAGAPGVANLCTLSPMPHFAAWLAAEAARGGGTPLRAALARAEAEAGGGGGAALARAGVSRGGAEGLPGGLLALLRAPQPWRWAASEPLLRRLLLEAGRFHLLRGGAGGGPGCKVAAFHLGNGAALARVCGGADASAGGLQRSGGLMANYAYSGTGAEGLRATVEQRAGEFREDPLAAIAAAEARRPVALEWEGFCD